MLRIEAATVLRTPQESHVTPSELSHLWISYSITSFPYPPVASFHDRATLLLETVWLREMDDGAEQAV